ncbi:hypothetical protein CPB84DRAFT_1847095 [Gymnopilus junonius]|uniref:Uncharacterized protein n=1 Tax=Gymnopilus junonius TaxID=109634 RepID=A0A9P5NN35_GYMJU|nr:hypothetical protein CPB84DRAFT_1847095 [Gymnopilus junonius]
MSTLGSAFSSWFACELGGVAGVQRSEEKERDQKDKVQRLMQWGSQGERQGNFAPPVWLGFVLTATQVQATSFLNIPVVMDGWLRLQSALLVALITKHSRTISDEELRHHQLSALREITDSPVQDIEATSVKKSSSPGSAAVPTTTQYATATGKEVLTILESAAGIIPVPFLQEAIGVALKIIQVCEERSAVEQKKIEEEANVKVAKNIENDVQGLLGTLGTIKHDLTEISEQNRWVIAFYKELNESTLEACMNRLSMALEKFKLANDLCDSDPLQELHTRIGKLSNKVNDVSRDMQHVVDKVDNIDTKLDEFHVLLSKSKRSATLLPSSAAVRQRMPLKPEVFYGRDALVEEIAQSLVKEETSRVCILGPAVFFAQTPVWVPCIGATSAPAFLETLYIQLQVPGGKRPTLEKIITELNACKDPRLIVFDNFETPWNAHGETQQLVGDILRRLSQIKHIAMLITMRGSYPSCDNAIKWQSKNIQPTDEETCFRIFHAINPASKDDPDVGRLLNSLGHMPFAVTLMANLGKEVHWTANDLTDAWLECGLDMFTDNPKKSMNRSISLSVGSDLVKQNSNAILLLFILSFLPAGTTKENLRWWAPTLKKSMIASAIATLSKAALLVQNEQQGSDSPILFVVPVIQSFMRPWQNFG